MKKRRKRKKKIKILIVLIITLTIILGFLYVNLNFLKLKNIGYNSSEIEVIENKLESVQIKKILENKYLNNLVEVISDERYNQDNFNEYLEMLKDGKSATEIYNNNNDYETNEKIELEDNKKHEYNSMKNKFKTATYYIDENIDRYLNYLNENPDKDIDEIIRCVNSNIDYEFYTNVTATDMSDGYLILVNKYTKLDKNYTPNLVTMSSTYSYGNMQMEATAYEHFKLMVDAAKNDGIKLYNISSYRSYNTQNYLYNNYVNSDGKKAADTFSARAGYSEHQTGLATDIITSNSSDHFENTKEYKWLINNSYKYGFILRYPQGKEYITGYKFEPWHYRYVGIDVAKYIKEHNITYEEYYAYFVKNK